MTDNPLLELWRQAHRFWGEEPDYDAMTRDLDIGHRDFDRWHEAWMQARAARSQAIKQYSFAVPTDEALDLIASFGPVVEIGAGTGYWARLLRARGCDVVAYDVMGESWRKWFPDGLCDRVLRGAETLAAAHPERTLLLVWPYMDAMAHDALTFYAKAGGRRLVYVGEGYGDACANTDFFDLLEAEWTEGASVAIPQWDGIRDDLTVYERIHARD